MKSSFEGKQMNSKDLKIKFSSGAKISFIGVDSEEYFKGFDYAKLMQSWEEYDNTDHCEDFEEFDLFEKQPKMKKHYSSKQRKIHKLKRDNVVLGQQRSSLLKNHNDVWSDELNTWTQVGDDWDYQSINKLVSFSERIGKNSAKIQRLRTQIQQEKKFNEYSSGS